MFLRKKNCFFHLVGRNFCKRLSYIFCGLLCKLINLEFLWQMTIFTTDSYILFYSLSRKDNKRPCVDFTELLPTLKGLIKRSCVVSLYILLAYCSPDNKNIIINYFFGFEKKIFFFLLRNLLPL